MCFDCGEVGHVANKLYVVVKLTQALVAESGISIIPFVESVNTLIRFYSLIVKLFSRRDYVLLQGGSVGKISFSFLC